MNYGKCGTSEVKPGELDLYWLPPPISFLCHSWGSCDSQVEFSEQVAG